MLQCLSAGRIGESLGTLRTEETAGELHVWTMALEGQEPAEWVLCPSLSPVPVTLVR